MSQLTPTILGAVLGLLVLAGFVVGMFLGMRIGWRAAGMKDEFRVYPKKAPVITQEKLK